MNIRPALETDLPVIIDLIRELAHFEKEPDAVEVTLEELRRDGFGDAPQFSIIVAEVENEILGMAFYYFRYSTWKGKTIHLEDLIVREKSRGTGAGTALYAAVIKRGAEEGVRRIEWAVLDWNEPAIAFYEKSGALILRDWHLVQMDQQGIKNFIDRL
ncbi:GNAT family N-acetyltransferase [Flavobacterium sp. NKUCC04_CG]|uniref:GNAT family N-acetyltransferase n=1 Tax=Flavobacterium sp. NKUCC04_CG TaxID=2842121 RepID=UPI001C5B8A8D|nr:GNAT family N-acetyltransferase [Flavobacterium sp. NKUCC04_CG]MBW3518370.1 GNAT family N-acetyltransferase [Flavobacterium sp. NKUCC04_CG]